MLEKDIENLIAFYPEEFFPNAGFRLKGQQVKLGRCHADIVFTDKYDRMIIVEVKRGLLSREGAGQIIEYYGLLKQQNPNQIVELILCANVIPHERKVFLENVGIECKELGVCLILDVARKHNYKFLDQVEEKQTIERFKREKHIFKEKYGVQDDKRIWIFQADPNRFDLLNYLSDPDLEKRCWQINQHKGRIKKGDIALIWMSGKEAGIYATAEVISDPLIMADFPGEEKYWMHDEDRGEKRLKVIIKVKKKLINNPAFRSELRNIEELRNLSVLRCARGTNFPITKDEWQVIKKKIDDKLG